MMSDCDPEGQIFYLSLTPMINYFSCIKGKRKIQGMPQSQAVVPPRHQEKEETEKTKQAKIEQTYEKH